MLKIGLIGVGACGNKIVALAAQEGFKCLAINTAEIDLKGLDLGNNLETMVIGDEGGTGKNRNTAKTLVKQNYNEMIRDIYQAFSDTDIIYYVGSADGGTGSGVIPILTEISKSSMPNNRFGNIIVMPSKSVSLKGQSNAVEYWFETKALEIPVIVYDNNKSKLVNMNESYESINKSIVQDLKILRGDYTSEPSPFGNIDDKDMLKLVATKGLMTISKVFNMKENDLDKNSVSEIILNSIKNNICVDFDRDKIIKRMGCIMAFPKAVMTKHDSSYATNREYAGEPIEIFENISIIDDQNAAGHMITIMSGLSYPETRISQIAKMVEEKKDSVSIVKNSTITESNQSVSWLKEDDVPSARKKNDTKTLNVNFDSNTLNKY